MTARAEHLAWCKHRALEYLDAGDVENALTSMLSDLDKHPETALPGGNVLAELGLFYALHNDGLSLRHWIEGFR